MRFDFTIFADNLPEVREALTSIGNALPSNIFDGNKRGFKIEVSSENLANTVTYGTNPLIDPPPAPATLARGETAENAAGEPAKRTRRTKAELAAAGEAKNGTVPQDPQEGNNAGATPGSDEDGENAVDPDVEPDVEEEAPADDTTGMSPAEAKLKALDVLREAYTLEGGPKAVKALQKTYDVAKFVQVPDTDGLNLLEQANELHATLTAAATLAKAA